MKSVKAQVAMAQVQELVSRMSEKCFAKVFSIVSVTVWNSTTYLYFLLFLVCSGTRRQRARPERAALHRTVYGQIHGCLESCVPHVHQSTAATSIWRELRRKRMTWNSHFSLRSVSYRIVHFHIILATCTWINIEFPSLLLSSWFERNPFK